MQLFESKTVLFKIISIIRVLPLLYSNVKQNNHEDELQNCFLSGKLGNSEFEKLKVVLPLMTFRNSHDDELQNCFLSGKLGISKFEKSKVVLPLMTVP